MNRRARHRCLNPFCTRTHTDEAYCSRKCALDRRLNVFQQAANPTCLDCGAESMGGGVWCLSCFNDPERDSTARVEARVAYVEATQRLSRYCYGFRRTA